MRHAFTLIELLVVVTIIVVLLAMLAPAMDKALRHTEMAVCASQLRGVGSGAILYAHDHKRRYPHRPGVHDPQMKGLRMRHLTASPLHTDHQNLSGYDDRPVYRSYFGLKALLCPLTETNLDLNTPDSMETTIFVSYAMWFGWKYTHEKGGAGMMRVGERLTWDRQRFNILAGDNLAFVALYGHVEASHPDSNGALAQRTADNEDTGAGGKVSVSHYEGGTPEIGTFNLNFATDDGAVQLYERVFYNAQRGTGWDVFRDDVRLSRVPFTIQEDTGLSRNIIPRGQ